MRNGEMRKRTISATGDKIGNRISARARSLNFEGEEKIYNSKIKIRIQKNLFAN